MSIDTYNEWNFNNPINEIESEKEFNETELEIIKNYLKLQTERLNYKIYQLKKLAEIERDLATFGTITYEQQLLKIEILNQY